MGGTPPNPLILIPRPCWKMFSKKARVFTFGKKPELAIFGTISKRPELALWEQCITRSEFTFSPSCKDPIWQLAPVVKVRVSIWPESEMDRVGIGPSWQMPELGCTSLLRASSCQGARRAPHGTAGDSYFTLLYKVNIMFELLLNVCTYSYLFTAMGLSVIWSFHVHSVMIFSTLYIFHA